MNIIFISTAILGTLGFIFGAGLTYISYKFSVVVDPRIEKLLGVLPNVNCGACGFAGCSNYAEKLANGDISAPNLCVPGGDNTASEVAKIMGITGVIGGSVQKTAVVLCGGGQKEAVKQFDYEGINTCTGANLLAGGCKVCKYGCLGYGDCVRVCPFNAVHINENGLPEVNKNCTGCGLCVKECPKKIIVLVDKEHYVNILCHSNDKGIVVKEICKKGCIACMRCVRACPKQAIELVNFLAFINYPKCDNCGECITVCPTNTIISKNEVSPINLDTNKQIEN